MGLWEADLVDVPYAAVPVVLETDRLRLVPLDSSRAEELAEIYADPEVARYIGGDRLTGEGTRAHGAVSVRQAFTEVRGQGMMLGPPKSRAGLRTVGLPNGILTELRDHLAQFVSPEPTALVFTGPKGAPIRRSNFNPLVGWLEAVEAIGELGLHFHDLRHTGNTLAAATGVSTRDLMARMGHDSMNAAIIYQHATREADHVIADGLDARLGVLRGPAKRVVPDPAKGESRDLVVTEVARELHERRF